MGPPKSRSQQSGVPGRALVHSNGAEKYGPTELSNSTFISIASASSSEPPSPSSPAFSDVFSQNESLSGDTKPEGDGNNAEDEGIYEDPNWLTHPKTCSAGKDPLIDLSDGKLSAEAQDSSKLSGTATRLSLARNSLKRLPRFLLSWSKLGHLDLSGNSLSQCPDLSTLVSLRCLNLAANGLVALDINMIVKCSELSVLSLRQNSLKELHVQIDRLVNLQYLDVAHNKLDLIPSSLGLCRKLEVLDLRNNLLNQLPGTLGKLPLLKTLRIEANPFINMLVELMRSESGVIKQFLQNVIPVTVRLEMSTPGKYGSMITMYQDAEKENNRLKGLIAEQEALVADKETSRLSAMEKVSEMERKYQQDKDLLNQALKSVNSLVPKLSEMEKELNESRERSVAFEKQIGDLNDRVNYSKKMAALLADESVPAPTGALCLVFTDIQGSTSQWEKHPDVMAMALRTHNTLFRTSMSKWKGYEVKTEGDAFMIAFQSPATALNCCVEIQQQLLTADWSPEVFTHPDAQVEYVNDQLLYRGIRVRMGLHFGEPLCERDPITGRMDYFGPVVNRAARVASTSHGGQIVISGSSLKAIRDSEYSSAFDISTSETTVSLLGDVQLKGIAEPEKVWELRPHNLSGRVFPPFKQKDTAASMREQLDELRNSHNALIEHISHLNAQVAEAKLTASILAERLRGLLDPKVRDESLEDALLQLEQMKGRLDDLKAEVNAQLESTGEVFRKTKQAGETVFADLKASNENLERELTQVQSALQGSNHVLAESRKEVEALKASVSALNSSLADTEMRASEAERNRDAFKSALATTEIVLQVSHVEGNQLKSSLESAMKELFDTKEESEALKNDLSVTQKELRTSQDEGKHLRTALTTSLSELSDLKEEAVQLKVSLSVLYSERMGLETKLREAEGTVSELKESEATLKEALGIANSKLSDLERRHEQLEQELLSKIESFKSSNADLSAAQELIVGLKASLASSNESLRSLREEHVALVEQHDATSHDLKHAQDRLTHLSSELASRESVLEGVRGRLSELEKEHSEKVAELRSTSDKLNDTNRRVAELTAVSESLSSTLDEQRSSAAALKSELESTKSSLAFVHTDLEEAQGRIAGLSSTISSLTNDLTLSRSQHDALSSTHSSASSQLEETQSHLFKSQTRIMELEASIATLQSNLHSLSEAHAHLQDTYTHTQSDLTSSRSSLDSAHVRISDLAVSVAGLESALRSAKAEKESLEEEIFQRTEQLAESQRMAEEATAQLMAIKATLEASSQAYEEQVQQLSTNLDVAHKKNDSAEDRVKELVFSVAELDERLKSAMKQISSVTEKGVEQESLLVQAHAVQGILTGLIHTILSLSTSNPTTHDAEDLLSAIAMYEHYDDCVSFFVAEEVADGQARAEKARYEGIINRLRPELARLFSERDALTQKQAEMLSSLNRLEGQVFQTQSAKEALERKVADLETQESILREECIRLHSQLTVATSKARDSAAQLVAVKAAGDDKYKERKAVTEALYSRIRLAEDMHDIIKMCEASMRKLHHMPPPSSSSPSSPEATPSPTESFKGTHKPSLLPSVRSHGGVLRNHLHVNTTAPIDELLPEVSQSQRSKLLRTGSLNLSPEKDRSFTSPSSSSSASSSSARRPLSSASSMPDRTKRSLASNNSSDVAMRQWVTPGKIRPKDTVDQSSMRDAWNESTSVRSADTVASRGTTASASSTTAASGGEDVAISKAMVAVLQRHLSNVEKQHLGIPLRSVHTPLEHQYLFPGMPSPTNHSLR